MRNRLRDLGVAKKSGERLLPPEKSHVLKPFFGLEGEIADPWPDEADRKALERYAGCAAELRAVLGANIDELINTMRPAPHPGGA